MPLHSFWLSTCWMLFRWWEYCYGICNLAFEQEHLFGSSKVETPTKPLSRIISPPVETDVLGECKVSP